MDTLKVKNINRSISISKAVSQPSLTYQSTWILSTRFVQMVILNSRISIMNSASNCFFRYVPSMFQICTTSVSGMYHVCSRYVPCMFQVCTMHVSGMYHACFRYVPCMFQVCTTYISFIFRATTKFKPLHSCSGKEWLVPSNITKYDVIYFIYWQQLFRPIWPSSGQYVNLENKFV
jgi:hypothetical protein